MKIANTIIPRVMCIHIKESHNFLSLHFWILGTSERMNKLENIVICLISSKSENAKHLGSPQENSSCIHC